MDVLFVTAKQIAESIVISNDANEDWIKEQIILYAKQKCKEQRDICANIAEANEGVTWGMEDEENAPKFE